jgi:hypothetical protein
MPFANVGGIFRGLMTQASVTELSLEDAVKVEELTKKIQAIYDRTFKQGKTQSRARFKSHQYSGLAADFVL